MGVSLSTFVTGTSPAPEGEATAALRRERDFRAHEHRGRGSASACRRRHRHATMVDFETRYGPNKTMKHAKVSELGAHLSTYLAHVRRGETVVASDRRTPIARLVPVDQRPEGATIERARQPVSQLRHVRGVRLRRRVDALASESGPALIAYLRHRSRLWSCDTYDVRHACLVAYTFT